jgi:hypothetical protein
MAIAAEQKFVVEHQGVGEFKRGDVISGRQMSDRKMDGDRLLSLKAMRPATPLEATLSHVSLPDQATNHSYEQRLLEKDQEIARLNSRIRDFEEKEAARALLSNQAAVSPNQAAVIAEKDATINQLNVRLKEFDNRRKAEEKANKNPAPPA